MANDTQKRCNLYFNTLDPEESKMWEWLNSKKKSKYIKRLIEDDMNRTNAPQQPQFIYMQPPMSPIYQPQQEIKEDIKEDLKRNLDLDDIDV